MTLEEVKKLLQIILDHSKPNDYYIISLIYMLVEEIENKCFGEKEQFMTQRFNRVYQELFNGIYGNLIADYDWLDETINEALNIRHKQIVNLEEK